MSTKDTYCMIGRHPNGGYSLEEFPFDRETPAGPSPEAARFATAAEAYYSLEGVHIKRGVHFYQDVLRELFAGRAWYVGRAGMMKPVYPVYPEGSY